jgi:nitrite reductase/ring-hydroxylating ferredoxin subunit/DMSO/TMAO reductase YedYZ heme-binding membrane subunit
LTIETLLIRAFGITAFVLLHVILCIGPLARLDARFLPLLYNRRHLGVTMCLLALTHGLFAVVQFHSGGSLDPLVSVLAGDAAGGTAGTLPFQPFGLAALAILLVMAATSHDFWLHNLSPALWKTLHMGVYLAYACLVLHVRLGVGSGQTEPWLGAALIVGAGAIFGLHGIAATREARLDRARTQAESDGFVRVGPLARIRNGRATVRSFGGERIAIFRQDDRVHALGNVCAHQHGPLGEGRIVNGCAVCPWHGYEYVPDTGMSPPPFTERVPTYAVRLLDGIVYVNPAPRS